MSLSTTPSLLSRLSPANPAPLPPVEPTESSSRSSSGSRNRICGARKPSNASDRQLPPHLQGAGGAEEHRIGRAGAPRDKPRSDSHGSSSTAAARSYGSPPTLGSAPISIGGTRNELRSHAADESRHYAAAAIAMSLSPGTRLVRGNSPRSFPTSVSPRSPPLSRSHPRSPAASHLQPLPTAATAAPAGRDTSSSRWATTPPKTKLEPAVTLSFSPPTRTAPASLSPPKSTTGAMGQIEAMLAKLRTCPTTEPLKSSVSPPSNPLPPSAPTPTSAPTEAPSAPLKPIEPTPTPAPIARHRISRPPDPVKRPALGGRSRWATEEDEDVDETVVEVQVEKKKVDKEIEEKKEEALPAPIPEAPTAAPIVDLAPPAPAPIISPSIAAPPSPIPRPSTPPPPSPPTPSAVDSTPSTPASHATSSPSVPSTPSWDSYSSSSTHIDWAEDDDDDLPPIDDWLAEPLPPSMAPALPPMPPVVRTPAPPPPRAARSRESSAASLPWSTPSATPSEGGGAPSTGKSKKRGGKGHKSAATSPTGGNGKAPLPLPPLSRDTAPHQAGAPAGRGPHSGGRGGRGGGRGGRGGRGGGGGGAPVGPDGAVFARLTGMGTPSPRGGRRGAGAGMAGAPGGGPRWN